MQLGEELQTIQVRRMRRAVKGGFTIHVSVSLQSLWSGLGFFFPLVLLPRAQRVNTEMFLRYLSIFPPPTRTQSTR